MEPTVYDQIVTKQAALTSMLAKIASENRGPNEAEKGQLDSLKTEIEAIKTEWESEGRKRFLESLNAPRVNGGPVVLKANQSFADVLKGSYPAEYENLSLRKILNGYVNGDWAGAELEMKAMASSPTSAGGILIPAVLSARIIDMARNLAAVLRAGAGVVPMTSAQMVMARQTQDVTAGWFGEGAAIDESDAAFDSVTFTARKMAALIRINNELLEDAANVDSVVQTSIAAAIALELDRVCLIGSGTPPEPKGIYSVTGVNAVNTVGTPADYDKFLEAIFQVRGYNFNPNAVIYSSRTAETLAKLKTGLSGDKTPLPAPADFAALSKFVSNQVANDQGTGDDESYAAVGQFDQLVVGLRHGIQVELSREAGDAFSKDQTLIRATWRGDVQALQPKAFSILKGIKA